MSSRIISTIMNDIFWDLLCANFCNKILHELFYLICLVFFHKELETVAFYVF